MILVGLSITTFVIGKKLSKAFNTPDPKSKNCTRIHTAINNVKTYAGVTLAFCVIAFTIIFSTSFFDDSNYNTARGIAMPLQVLYYSNIVITGLLCILFGLIASNSRTIINSMDACVTQDSNDDTTNSHATHIFNLSVTTSIISGISFAFLLYQTGAISTCKKAPRSSRKKSQGTRDPGIELSALPSAYEREEL